ncbi:putative signal transducing protein [Microaceticoccus formicicus]|uniref:putative signal transducing protein n=1 Tax=Microaceticoccus formicicus TaxID=3118105 RepID=UPI003CD012E2|nr:DUF2007 domain-containing protein [Peptoniphilaceae bacterium AMB_02]
MFKKKKDNNSEIELVLLRSTNDDFELLTIKSLLEENNIPYIIKDRGAGGYMRLFAGGSVFGSDIFIEKSQLEEVSRILEDIFPEDKEGQ